MYSNITSERQATTETVHTLMRKDGQMSRHGPTPAKSVARLGTESAFAVLARARDLERQGRDLDDVGVQSGGPRS